MECITKARNLSCFLLILLCICGCASADSMESVYQQATHLLAQGEYSKAAEQFDSISLYENSSMLASYCRAISVAESGDFKNAATSLSNLGDLLDAESLAIYYRARQHEEAEESLSAIELYQTINAFKDSAQRASNLNRSDFVKRADRLYGYSNGLARFLKDGKYGFVDTSGNISIPPVWDYAYDFSDGLALVYTGLTTENGEPTNGSYQYIDSIGKIAINSHWDKARSFENGLAVVYSGLVLSDGSTSSYDSILGRYGLIDKRGNLICDYIWDRISPFEDGYAEVLLHHKSSYINTSGQDLNFSSWDDVDYRVCGLFEVSDGRNCGIVDYTGEIIVPLEWDRFWFIGSKHIIAAKGESLSILNMDGSYATETIYDRISHHDHHIICVWQNGVQFHLNIDANELVKSKWDYIYPFSEGLALVFNGSLSTYDGEPSIGTYGYIDTDYNIVSELQWRSAKRFINGIAHVRNDYAAIINSNGKVIGGEIWREIADAPSDGMIAVKQINKWGYIDIENNTIILPQWDKVTRFQEGLAVVWNDSEWSVIDKLGNIIY